MRNVAALMPSNSPYCANFDHLGPSLPKTTKEWLISKTDRGKFRTSDVPEPQAAMTSSGPRCVDAKVSALPTLAPYPPDLREIVVAVRAIAARQKQGSERAMA